MMIIVVMGVSGCGKSTIGKALSQVLGWSFQEGDALHPAANVEKMQAGIPLDDDDRRPWLDRLCTWMRDENAHARDGVLTCSALKRMYRDRLRDADEAVAFAYIHVSRAELERRTTQRQHFMPASLLDSQLQTLETPGADERAITVHGEASIERMIAQICYGFGLGRGR